MDKMKNQNQETKRDWETEFDQRYVLLGDEGYPFRAIPKNLKENIKSFIRQLVAQTAEEAKSKERERLREKIKGEITNFTTKGEPQMCWICSYWGKDCSCKHNIILSDRLSALDEEK